VADFIPFFDNQPVFRQDLFYLFNCDLFVFHPKYLIT
jgi:hypothetical protein